MAEEISSSDEASAEVTHYRVPGLLGWALQKHPEVLGLCGAVVFTAGGIAMLLSNPAGNSTQGEQYGPDAPLQVWVVVVAFLLFALALFSIFFMLLFLWQRVTGRRQ